MQTFLLHGLEDFSAADYLQILNSTLQIDPRSSELLNFSPKKIDFASSNREKLCQVPYDNHNRFMNQMFILEL